MNCAGCRFWGADHKDFTLAGGWKRCPVLSGDDGWNHHAAGLGIEAYWYGGVNTAPDFFCRNFEEAASEA